jgi:hypothetical protein
VERKERRRKLEEAHPVVLDPQAVDGEVVAPACAGCASGVNHLAEV